LAAIVASTLFAADLVTSSVDGGGGRSGAGSYTNDGCVGGIGGIGSSGSQVARHGFAGQLTEVTGLSVTGTPTQLNEGATSQLSGAATMDDDTVTDLSGSDINWSVPSWPLASISASGVASAAVVYANTSASVNGVYLDVPGSNSVLVLNTDLDNYGIYDSDGIADSWQIQFFGFDNPDAAPSADVTGTGQNNLFKYIAGLDPTNVASVFRLRILPVAGQPNQKQLMFNPRWDDRVYTPLFRTNLLSGTWMTLTDTNVTDNGAERTVTDTNAIDNARFYRIQITYP